MSLAEVWGVVTTGVAGVMVKVEVDVAQGLPSVGVIGLAGASVTEARWRARSAIGNIGATWPAARITIGLSPADLPKSGTSLDLPIAVGVLAATGQVPGSALRDIAFIGELGLDGSVREVDGALAAAIAAHRHGVGSVCIPSANARQVRVIPGLRVVAIRDLAHLIRVLRGEVEVASLQGADETGAERNLGDECSARHAGVPSGDMQPDFSEIRGHPFARFGLEVVAAGGHHCSMVGPPGVGKSMLANRLPTILPDLPIDIALEVTAIASLAGQWPVERGLVRRPLLQAPHHSSSPAAILGTSKGRQSIPGALSLAHHGVLFLDEAPEFSRPSLEGLRQPMESGVITVMRAAASATLPARFQLILASNPCPCGLAVGRGDACTCSPMARRRYAERLSGPLLDRIDVRLSLPKPSATDLASAPAESSAEIRERVLVARARAGKRFEAESWSLNAHVPGTALRQRWRPTPEAESLIRSAERTGISLRSADRLLRIAWTVADLAGAACPNAEHVAAAMGLRGVDVPGGS